MKTTHYKVTSALVILLLGASACSTAAFPAPQLTAAPTEPPAQMTEPPTEPAITEAPIVVTEAPTEPPLACVTLLTPENSADLPTTGKVTFSWTPMDGAGNYVLNIILPSGETVTFETNQTFRDRYMEAFTAGGEYGWKVTAQGADGNEICISEAFAFDKPEYQKQTGGGGGSDSGGDDGEELPSPPEMHGGLGIEQQPTPSPA